MGFDAGSNALFQIAAAFALVVVGLSPAYALERWARLIWRRAQRLNELACRDGLTGLANRRHFDATLQQLVRTAARERKSVALMILDVDHFKLFNDHYGHPAGDACLRMIGRYLAGAVRRPQDFAARLGGEEFAAVWFDAGPADALRLAEDLRRGLVDLGIGPAPGQGSGVTASAGFVHVGAPLPGGAAEEVSMQILRLADAALYAAKRGGRDRLVTSEWRLVRDASDEFAEIGESAVRHAHLEWKEDSEDAAEQSLAGLCFEDACLEKAFRASFEQQGRASRQLILVGLLLVIVGIFTFQRSLLKIPEGAEFMGRLTLLVGLLPATALALLGSTWHRLRRWSAALYIAAITIILLAQMAERVIQLPKGHNVVPFIMPLSVLLSLNVVQIRFRVLVPVSLLLLAGVVGAELWFFPLDTYRLLSVAVAILMVLVTLHFSSVLERWTRIGWLRQQQLQERAFSDGLTGLANRRHFDDALLQGIRAAVRERRSVALMILDVDHFKDFNDQYGHPAGDACLRAIGRYLNGAMRRPQDFAARLGGEEFAAVWFDAGPAEAPELAENLRRGVGRLGMAPASGHGEVVTCSAGFIQLIAPQPDVTAEQIAAQLLRKADAALYRAKLVGRDRLVVLDAEKGAFPGDSARRSRVGR